jgi:hypothetical protein
VPKGTAPVVRTLERLRFVALFGANRAGLLLDLRERNEPVNSGALGKINAGLR